MKQLAVALFCLLLLALSSCAFYSNPAPCAPIQRGLGFLSGQLNPSLNLLREASGERQHIYWLANDNLLAMYVFTKFGKVDLATQIKTAILQYHTLDNGLIEVMNGTLVKFPPHSETNISLQPSENHAACFAGDTADRICIELRDRGNLMRDWRDYANLAFLDALNEYQMGNKPAAREIFNQTMNQFNGEGFPIRKNLPSPDGGYETYKVALALYTGAKLQVLSPEQKRTLLEILLARQAPSGGFFTHYPDSEKPGRYANTETTSFALLAIDAMGCE